MDLSICIFFAFILLSRFAFFFFAFILLLWRQPAMVQVIFRVRRQDTQPGEKAPGGDLENCGGKSWVTPGITEEPEKPRKALITARLLIQLLMLHSG